MVARNRLRDLVKNVASESDIDALAVVENGRVLAGVGSKAKLRQLGRIAHRVADEPTFELADASEESDVMARAIDIDCGSRRVYLAALGRRVRQMVQAGEAIARILAA